MEKRIVRLDNSSFSIEEKKLSIINQPTPENVLKVRKGRGGLRFVYVETNWVIRRLNEVFGYGWDFEILEQTPVELAIKLRQIVVKGKLTIKDAYGRTASKTQFGSAEVKFLKDAPKTIENVVDIADDYKAASSDALKKCASYFGIALDVYSGEFTPEDLENTQEVEVEQPQEEKPKWTPTNAQLRLLWKLANKNGVSEEEVHKIIKQAWGLESIKDLDTPARFDELLDFVDPKGKEGRDKIRKEFVNKKENR